MNLSNITKEIICRYYENMLLPGNKYVVFLISPPCMGKSTLLHNILNNNSNNNIKVLFIGEKLREIAKYNNELAEILKYGLALSQTEPIINQMVCEFFASSHKESREDEILILDGIRSLSHMKYLCTKLADINAAAGDFFFKYLICELIGSIRLLRSNRFKRLSSGERSDYTLNTQLAREIEFYNFKKELFDDSDSIINLDKNKDLYEEYELMNFNDIAPIREKKILSSNYEYSRVIKDDISFCSNNLLCIINNWINNIEKKHSPIFYPYMKNISFHYKKNITSFEDLIVF